MDDRSRLQEETQLDQQAQGDKKIEQLQSERDEMWQKYNILKKEKEQLELNYNKRTMSPTSNSSIENQLETRPLEIKFDNIELDKDSDDIQNQIQAMKLKSSQKEQIQKLVQ